jgi:hypothetical protein
MAVDVTEARNDPAVATCEIASPPALLFTYVFHPIDRFAVQLSLNDLGLLPNAPRLWERSWPRAQVAHTIVREDMGLAHGLLAGSLQV